MRKLRRRQWHNRNRMLVFDHFKGICQIFGDIAGKVVGKQAAKSAEGKFLAKQADRIQRVNTENPRASRTEAAKQATQKASNYVQRRAVAASTASSGIAGKAGNIITKVVEEDKAKKQK